LPPEDSDEHGEEESNDDSYRDNGGAKTSLNLGYTINLNLPATSDAGVYNAIFRSLRENLLKDLE
jgi:hypothetical protein